MPGLIDVGRRAYLDRVRKFCGRVQSDEGFANQLANRWAVGYIRAMGGDVVKKPIIP